MKNNQYLDNDIIRQRYISFDGVVVITSALHAEGREFDPRSKYFFKIIFMFINLIFSIKLD